MHPVFIIFVIASAVWFFAVAAMARKGVGAQLAFAFLGIVVFLVLTVVLGQVMESQDFFRRAIRSGPDIGPITKFIVLPSAILVFLFGLLLKRILGRPNRTEGGG
jgi:hypothetical protein